MLQGESEMKLPEKKYAVIYADPPWSYRQHGTGPKSRGNAAQHYHTMTVEDICALPVRQLAGGGTGMRAVHVGDIPNHPRCAEGYGRMGLYIQNGGIRLDQKIQVGRKLLWNGCLHSCKCRGLLVGSDAGIQGKSIGQKPYSAPGNRIPYTSAQRKTG